MTIKTVVVYVFVVLLFYDATYIACLCIHLKQTVGVMTTLIECKCHMTVVILPFRGIHIVLMLKQFGTWLYYLTTLNFYDYWYTIVQ